MDLPREQKCAILEGKVREISASIFSLTMDAQAAKIIGTTENNERIEKLLASNLKLLAAYEQLLDKEKNAKTV